MHALYTVISIMQVILLTAKYAVVQAECIRKQAVAKLLRQLQNLRKAV